MPEPYWKSDLHEAVSAVFAQHIGDPYRQDPVWISIGERLTTSRDLSDFFHQMNADGFPLEESKILQQLLVDTETVTPWLVYDILPQLQVTRDRFQTLDAAVDSISRRFSAFVKDISEALPGYYDPLYFPNNSLQKRLNDLSAVLQQHNAIRCLDDDKGTLLPDG